MSKLSEQIKANFPSNKMSYFDVPEINIDGKPLRIYHTPMTVSDQLKCLKGLASEGENLSRSEHVLLCLNIIVEKSLDSDGNKIFDNPVEDKMMLERLPQEVVLQITNGIAGEGSMSVEDAAKN